MADQRFPSFWVTTIAKALSGDQPCQLATWLSGHYDLDKRPQDDPGSLAKWRADHTAQLDALCQELQANGWRVKKEQFARVKGTTSIVSLKCDALTQADGKRPKIWDVKSGRPRDSDVTQVLLEMILIPLAWHAPSMQFDGCVVYPTHRVELKPSQAADLKPRMVSLLRQLATMSRPAASPGRDACRFCDVPDDECAERFHQDTPDAETTEF